MVGYQDAETTDKMLTILGGHGGQREGRVGDLRL